MTAEYVRNYYGVPAKRGGRIICDGRPARITGFDQQYLRIRFDGEKHTVRAHPTWRVEYVETIRAATE